MKDSLLYSVPNRTTRVIQTDNLIIYVKMSSRRLINFSFPSPELDIRTQNSGLEQLASLLSVAMGLCICTCTCTLNRDQLSFSFLREID